MPDCSTSRPETEKKHSAKKLRCLLRTSQVLSNMQGKTIFPFASLRPFSFAQNLEITETDAIIPAGMSLWQQVRCRWRHMHAVRLGDQRGRVSYPRGIFPEPVQSCPARWEGRCPSCATAQGCAWLGPACKRACRCMKMRCVSIMAGGKEDA